MENEGETRRREKKIRVKNRTKSHSPIVLGHAQNKHESLCVLMFTRRWSFYLHLYLFFSSQMNLLHYLGIISNRVWNWIAFSFFVCLSHIGWFDYYWHFNQYSDEWKHFSKWYFCPHDCVASSSEWQAMLHETPCKENMLELMSFWRYIIDFVHSWAEGGWKYIRKLRPRLSVWSKPEINTHKKCSRKFGTCFCRAIFVEQ